MFQRTLACCLAARRRVQSVTAPSTEVPQTQAPREMPYRYAPLKSIMQEIRLVHLLAGDFDDDIEIQIAHAQFFLPDTPDAADTTTNVEALRHSVARPWEIEETEGGDFILFNVVTGESKMLLQAAARATMTTAKSEPYEPQFEALSYTWGDGDISECARVKPTPDGRATATATATLGLRPNLASALRHLRHTHSTRVLWIDAICINQDDVEERNEQVKRMASIYTLAHTVVVWLGEATADSTHALTTLHGVAQQLTSTKSGRVIAAPGAAQPRLWRNDCAPAFDDATWAALASFVARPWFYRLWCWQEIKLGGRSALLQCGVDTIPWSAFWLAVLCLHNKDSTPSMLFRERCRHIVFLKHDAASTSVSNILDISRSKGCADPRDKIYGLLGITPAAFRMNIAVDYLRPVEAVYKEAFLANLQATQRLELLKHCDLAARQLGGPSWVPDWSPTEFVAPILSEQLSAGHSRAWFTHDAGADVLTVAGKLCTTIQSVASVASTTPAETLLVVKDWFAQRPPPSAHGTYVTGESMEAAFALTLCMDRKRERHPGSHFLSTPEWVAMMQRMLRLTTGSWTDGDTLFAARETANTIQKVRGRRFFTTASGHMGTAPAGAQPGDAICVLLGTYAPLVLRPTADGQFRVVGECYVHGLSDAVGLLGPLPDGWTTIIRGDSHGQPMQLFANAQSREEMREDPRLPRFEDTMSVRSWERAVYERRPGDPVIFDLFRNTETGEVVNHDPRMTPDVLAAVGIELQSFDLV